MTKYILALSVFLSISPIVLAGTLTFYKPGLDEEGFKTDYKTETGLPPISRECLQSTCTVSGHYDYKGSTLTVVVYESLDPDNVHITSSTLTGDATGQIATAVNNN